MQLDQLRWEKERLLAENARLKSEKPDHAAISAALAEFEQYRQENDHLVEELRGMREKLARARSHDLSLELQESAVIEAQRQITEDLQAELEETAARCKELDSECNELHCETKQLREQAELERLQAVELECSKWEAREERLVG